MDAECFETPMKTRSACFPYLCVSICSILHQKWSPRLEEWSDRHFTAGAPSFSFQPASSPRLPPLPDNAAHIPSRESGYPQNCNCVACDILSKSMSAPSKKRIKHKGKVNKSKQNARQAKSKKMRRSKTVRIRKVNKSVSKDAEELLM